MGPAGLWLPVPTDATGNLAVYIAAGGASGGTSSTFGAALPATGTATGFKKSSDGTMQAPTLDDNGYVQVNIKTGGGSGTIPSTATLANIAADGSNHTALASNAGRLGAAFDNDTDAACYLKFGATASATSFTAKLLSGERYEIPPNGYSGRVDVIHDAEVSTGSLRVTEMSA